MTDSERKAPARRTKDQVDATPPSPSTHSIPPPLQGPSRLASSLAQAVGITRTAYLTGRRHKSAPLNCQRSSRMPCSTRRESALAQNHIAARDVCYCIWPRWDLSRTSLCYSFDLGLLVPFCPLPFAPSVLVFKLTRRASAMGGAQRMAVCSFSLLSVRVSPSSQVS